MKGKIIHLVLGKANPNRMNGVNKVAHNHAVYLHQLGMDVEIWGITKTPGDTVHDRPFPTRLFRAQPFYRDIDPQLMIAISRLPKQTVFHIHGAFISDFYKVTSLLRDLNIAYIYTPHGAFNAVALEKNKLIKKIYIQRYEKGILRGARKVHFLGQSEYDHVGRIIKLNNKVIIPNGQNFDELKFDFHPVQKTAAPVFGFCGRLDSYYKGLDLLLLGFGHYVNHGGTGELWLIGDGPDRLDLENAVSKMDISNRVHFFGAKYGRDKLNRIANMDIFCHPSRSEGSPTAVLEAGALKKPLLVTTGTNVGALVDQYDCGIHLKTLSVPAINKALKQFEYMHQQGLTADMGTRACNMVQNEFDWTRIAEKLTEIYEIA